LAGAIFRYSRAVWLHSGDGTSDRGDGAGRGDHCGTALVYVVELLAVLRGFTLVLQLRGHGRNTRPSIGYKFGRLRTDVDATATAVVRDTIGVVDDDRAVIHIRDAGDVNVVDGAVVVEVMALPVSAVISVAGVPVAVVNAAVEADVWPPEAAVKDVETVEEAPVTGGPKGAVEGRSAPCAGNPVVAHGGVCPVARGPEIVGRGGFGLLIDGKRRRRLVGLFEGLLACVYLSIGGRGVVVVVVIVVGGLSGLSGGVSLILRRWRGLGGVLLGALLGLGLGTSAKNSSLSRLRVWCGLELAVVDGGHVGVGWIGA
jgi:hypothetical protein